MTGALATACAVAALTALAPAAPAANNAVSGHRVVGAASRPSPSRPEAPTSLVSVSVAAPTRAAAPARAENAARASDPAAASARLDGLTADLNRAVANGHVTAEQATRFRAELAGYILA